MPLANARVIELRPVVAVVLDLFGAPEREVRAWRPTVFAWQWAGLALPISEGTYRQYRMLRPDTLVEVDE